MLKIRLPPEWGVDPVPVNAKGLRFIDYFALWSSLGVGLLVFLAGSLLYPSLGMMEVLAVSTVGSIVGSVLLASAGVVGSRYGVPTMVSLRPILGARGSYLPTCLNVIQLIGWTTFELIIMSEAAASISGSLLGPCTKPVWIIVFAVFCSLLALGGPVAVVRQWLEKAAIWLVYGSTIWITVQVLSKPGALTAFFKPGTGGMPLPYALDLVIAMPISWWPLISDYNRFARSDKEGFTGTVVGYTIANTWFYFLGAAIVAFTGITDIVSSISILFLGALALLLILVDETDNAFADIYSSAISLQNLFPRVKQRRFILLVAGVSVALAVSMPLTQYEYFLLMIGALFVPLLGTLFSEFFIVRKRRYRIEEFYSKAEALNPRALTSWLIGVAFYFALARFYPWAGSSLPSFLTSALINYAFSRLKR